MIAFQMYESPNNSDFLGIPLVRQAIVAGRIMASDDIPTVGVISHIPIRMRDLTLSLSSVEHYVEIQHPCSRQIPSHQLSIGRNSAPVHAYGFTPSSCRARNGVRSSRNGSGLHIAEIEH
jgi:hypothetical protein